jgi:hypothetical protein
MYPVVLNVRRGARDKRLGEITAAKPFALGILEGE